MMFRRGWQVAVLFLMALLLGVATSHAAKGWDNLYKAQHEMLAFIGEHTDYVVEGLGPPRYKFVSYEFLETIQGEGSLAAHSKGVIFLPEDFELPRDSWKLMHEMVHFVQHQNGAEFECRSAKEKEAYELQMAWVDKVGHGKKPNELFFFMLTCEFGEGY